ncbi:MAG: L-rhamnose mutarotase [Coprobacillaceae bacterium]
MKLATKMKLNEGMVEEYIRRHKKVFPDLEAEFIKAQVSDYTIWYDAETNHLFAYIVLEDIEVWNQIANTDACKKWWKYMAPLMKTNSDYSPVSSELKLVYEFSK